MKSLIISAALVAAVIWGSVSYTAALENVSSQMLELNSEISAALTEHDFDTASNYISSLEGYIDSKATFLSALNNHLELDNIEMSLSELKRYTEGHSHTDALSKCEVLDFLFMHLPKDYRLRLENIL